VNTRGWGLLLQALIIETIPFFPDAAPCANGGMEMRKLFTLAAVATMPYASHAAESDYPSFLTVGSIPGREVLGIACKPPTADGLHCSFTKMTISKPPEKEAQKRIAEAIESLMKEPAPKPEECASISKLLEAVETGSAPPFGDPQEFNALWMQLPPEARALAMTSLKALIAFCTAPDRKKAEAVAIANERISGGKCRVSSSTFEKTFQLNVSTKKWQSTQQQSDPCGTISYAEFEKADERGLFWNFTTKDIVTNPKGKSYLGESCSSMDQAEHRYTWSVTEFYSGCDYIKLGPWP
jgi:hypothetical protein